MTIIDNIDERAKFIYDYIYNHNEKKYKKNFISLQNINKDNIKESNHNFWINNILNNNIKFIKKINNIYLFKRISNNLSLNIFLYPLDENNLDNLHSQTNMNAVMSYILSELSINNKTRHLLLNLLNIDIDTNDIEDFLIKFPEIDIHNFLKYKKIGMSVTEHFFKINTLDEVLKENNFNDVKYQVLFFQILHTLAVIQKEYPEFRHNQMQPNKIYCYFKNKQNSYSFDNIIFNVPNIDFDIKLYHYDKSNIYSRWDNQDLTEEEKIMNRSYDWLSFINTLDNKKLPPKAKEFVDEMLKLNINKESITPINLILSHNYFNSLRKNISNNNIMKNKMKHTETTSLSSDSNDVNNVIKGFRELNLNKLKNNQVSTKTNTKRSKKNSKRSNNKKKIQVDSLDDITINSDELKEIYNFKKNKTNSQTLNNNGQALKINNLGSALGIDSNYLNHMGMNQTPGMGMAGMGMPGMGMAGMGMPGMGMPSMGMAGMGMNQMQGMGMPGMGMNQMPEMGMQGMGVNQMPGMGMNQMPEMGMQSMGVNQMPEMGMQSMGVNQMPGMGMNQMPEMGMNQMPGMGMNQMPEMGINQMPGMGMNQMPGMGMPGMGMNQMPEMGMPGMGMPGMGMNTNMNGGGNNFFLTKI